MAPVPRCRKREPMGKRYKFKDRYGATIQRAGRNEVLFFSKGDVAELDDDVADFIKRDCPNVIVRAQGVKKNAEKKTPAKAPAKKTTPKKTAPKKAAPKKAPAKKAAKK